MGKITKIVSGILLVAFLGGAALWYMSPSNNGVEYHEKYSALALKNGVACQYVGFGDLWKKDVLEVYTACQAQGEIGNGESPQSKEELQEFINKYMVEPNLKAAPTEPGVHLVSIVQIKENVVLCSKLHNTSILESWFDSYENYCLPP